MTQNRYIATVVAAICLISLAACGGGGGGGSRPALVTPDPEPTPPRDPTAEPSYHLNTARFTTHQPKVLEQIGAHHAYARGLTGSGVRIGIEDSIVDYTQSAEFGNRVRLRAEDGARLGSPISARMETGISATHTRAYCSTHHAAYGKATAQEILKQSTVGFARSSTRTDGPPVTTPCLW